MWLIAIIVYEHVPKASTKELNKYRTNLKQIHNKCFITRQQYLQKQFMQDKIDNRPKNKKNTYESKKSILYNKIQRKRNQIINLRVCSNVPGSEYC